VVIHICVRDINSASISKKSTEILFFVFHFIGTLYHLFLFEYLLFLDKRAISLHIILIFLTVADMCKSSSATEEKYSGSFSVDTVVLRIMTQDNCICRVTLYNQVEPVSIGLSKYDGLTSSAPEDAQCGLAVDINHIPDMSTGNIIAPIKCIENVNFRNLPLFENSTLEFKSRIINRSFNSGQCMLIHRGTLELKE